MGTQHCCSLSSAHGQKGWKPLSLAGRHIICFWLLPANRAVSWHTVAGSWLYRNTVRSDINTVSRVTHQLKRHVGGHTGGKLGQQLGPPQDKVQDTSKTLTPLHRKPTSHVRGVYYADANWRGTTPVSLLGESPDILVRDQEIWMPVKQNSNISFVLLNLSKKISSEYNMQI